MVSERVSIQLARLRILRSRMQVLSFRVFHLDPVLPLHLHVTNNVGAPLLATLNFLKSRRVNVKPVLHELLS